MQCADMLCSDLRELNKHADPMLHLLVLDEIKKAREIQFRLGAIAAALKVQ